MSIVKSIGVLTIGNGLSQVINLLGILFLSRLYTPSQFGVYAVVLGVATVIGVASTLRLEMTILLPKCEFRVPLAVVVSLTVAMILNLVFLLIISVLALNDLLSFYWLQVPILSLALAIISIGGFYQNRTRKYVGLATVQVVKSSVFIFFAIIFGMYDCGVLGLITAMTLSVVLPSIYLLVGEFWHNNLLVMCNKRYFFSWFRQNKKFVYYSAPAVFVNSLSAQAPVFLLAQLYSNDAAGFYSIVQRIMAGPVNLISGAVNKVYMQNVARLRASRQPIFKFTRKLVGMFIVPSLFICIVLFILFEYELLFRLLGQNWKMIDQIALLMIPSLAISFVAKSISGFSILGRNELGLIYQIILLFSVIALLLLAKGVSDSIMFAFGMLSFGLTICYSGQMISILRISASLDVKQQG